MMMSTPTKPQAQALAAFVATLRNGWDSEGVLVALRRAHDAHKPDIFTLARAAIAVAADPTNRNPAVIAFDGPHWAQNVTGQENAAEPCPVHAPVRPAWNCPLCRAEHLATDQWPAGTRHHKAPKEN